MSDKQGAGFSLKDHLFNAERVQYLADRFHIANSGFDRSGFVRDRMQQLPQLELKARIVHVATSLERYLDDDFRVAAKQIVAALPEPLDPTGTDDDFGDFNFAPPGEFVVGKGLSKKHVRISLKTLMEITQRFSMKTQFDDLSPACALRCTVRWRE